MLKKRIEGSTRVLAKDQEYQTLHIRDYTLDGGGNVMESAWEPTPDEIAAIRNGASVHLHIMGEVFPPVMLTVGEVPSDD